MTAIAYYISGHGFGHAVRSRAVIRSLKEACPEIACHVRTTAPRWLFTELPFPISYFDQSTDVGIVQKDSLIMDLEATFRACQSLHRQIPDIIKQEISFIEKAHVRLVLGDIPPLCFEIGDRAALPSVAITNFTWNWIYRAYLDEFPAFLPLIEQTEDSYRKASLCLSLPFSADLDTFARREPIPLIARISKLDKRDARKKYCLPGDRPIVLLSFGGLGLDRLARQDLERQHDYFFVGTGNKPLRAQNLAVLAEAQLHYEDLVRAADVIITKPGYGIVADVIAHRVPVLYTSRGPFPEYSFLVQNLKAWATTEFIPQHELLAGNITPYIRHVMEKAPNWPDVPLDGAQVAAARILQLLR